MTCPAPTLRCRDLQMACAAFRAIYAAGWKMAYTSWGVDKLIENTTAFYSDGIHDHDLQYIYLDKGRFLMGRSHPTNNTLVNSIPHFIDYCRLYHHPE